jgi:hypothetical protein
LNSHGDLVESILLGATQVLLRPYPSLPEKSEVHGVRGLGVIGGKMSSLCSDASVPLHGTAT